MSNEKSPTWPYVLAFAQQMERQLSRHRDRGDRPGWMSAEPRDLVLEMKVQTDKAGDLVEKLRMMGETRPELPDVLAVLLKRCAHAANFAMMVADRLGALDVEHLGPGMLPPPEALAVERSAGDAPETAEQWKNQTLRLRKELSAERERCADLAHQLQQADEKGRDLSGLAYERKQKMDEARSDLAATRRSLDDANAVAIEAEKQVAAEKAAHAKTQDMLAKTQDVVKGLKAAIDSARSTLRATHVPDGVLP